MGFWGWVGAIAAGWFIASIVLAIAWGLAGYRLRKPRPVKMVPWTTKDADRVDVDRVIAEIERRDRLNGRGF